jgi:hypothetical protein
VNVVDVEVVRTKPLQRSLDLRSDVLAREVSIESAFGRVKYLARDYEFLSMASLEPLPNVFLALSAPIVVGRIDEVDTLVLSRVEQFVRFLSIRFGYPAGFMSESPRSEAHFRHFRSGIAQFNVLHAVTIRTLVLNSTLSLDVLLAIICRVRDWCR